jgi:Domain of unknown function (DUF1851)
MRSFTAEQYAQALASWRWAGLDGKSALFTSPFGDVFFASEDGYWYLDTQEGSLTRPWRTAAELESELASPQGQGRYLLANLALAAEDRGLTLNPAEVYAFVVPPILGGHMAVDRIQVMDFVVSLEILGQIHDQVRGLPPGTRISGVVVDNFPDERAAG